MGRLTKDEIKQINKRLVWRHAWLTTYSPGDGKKRYRLIDAKEWAERHDYTIDDLENGIAPEPDYFGGYAIATALGPDAARAMIDAYIEGWDTGRRA